MPRASTMHFTEAVAIAASSLWAHKLRSVRKAMGAKRSNILAQFLIEAVTLSAVGGVIGVILGSGLTLTLRYGLKVPATLSLFWIVTALVLCAMIGIVFGVYPAWKAARLDPVEALRYE